MPLRSKGTSIASRVVPGRSKAITRSSPIKVLIKVDLPTFGRPTTAIFIGRVPSKIDSSSGTGSGICNRSKASSNKERTPSPWAEEIASGSPKASSWKSAVTTLCGMPSVLFTANMTGRPVLRKNSAITRSWGAKPKRPSTKKIMRSDSATACLVCFAISAKIPVFATGSKPPVSMQINSRSPTRPLP